jgi:hypothetical protein
VLRAPAAVDSVVLVGEAGSSWRQNQNKRSADLTPAAVDSVVLGEAGSSWRQNQNKRSADLTTDSAEVCWRQNKNKVPKAPPRSKKSASPVSKRGLGRLPSDTEEGASNLIASCEKYLDENPVIINPFIDVKMDQSAEFRGSDTSLAQAHRKLSSVSDIRDSIKVTHEDANLSYVAGCQTVPRAFSPCGVSSSPVPTRAHARVATPVRTLDRPAKPRKSSAPVVTNRRPSQGLYKRQDGTESVKSFVIVSKNSCLDLNSDEEDSSSFPAKNLHGDNFDNSDDDEWSDDNDNSYNKSSDFTNSKNNPRNKGGFVNKCVTRVKSLVNPVKN